MVCWTMQDKVKIAIVGPEESKWKSKEQIEKAKKEIEGILRNNATKQALHENLDVNPVFAVERGCKLITLVSGHCPVGRELWYCVNCHGWDGDGKEPDPHPNAELHHGVIKVYDKGGVDTWAEIIAAELGIKKEIYPAEVNQWPDDFPIEGSWTETRQVRKKGYKSRNIQIAESLKDVEDRLYCIVPYVQHPKTYDEHITLGGRYLPNIEKEPVKSHFCFHCNEWGHPTNGGCWTMKYAKAIGKETHLVVIQ